MVPVDDLDEGAHLGTTEDLLLGHCLGDLARGSADTSDEAVAIATSLGALKALHDDSLLTSITAAQKDNNLARLKESLAHVDIKKRQQRKKITQTNKQKKYKEKKNNKIKIKKEKIYIIKCLLSNLINSNNKV